VIFSINRTEKKHYPFVQYVVNNDKIMIPVITVYAYLMINIHCKTKHLSHIQDILGRYPVRKHTENYQQKVKHLNSAVP
jgi:hypothetical protein